MSVVVVVRLKADAEKTKEALRSHSADVEQVSADAKAAGALSHRFVWAGDEVLIIDEWNDAAAFREFFGTNKTIAQVMQAAGVTDRPTMDFYEPLEAPGTF